MVGVRSPGATHGSAAKKASETVKQAAGTLRVVERLAYLGMLVEFEFWLAK